MVFSDYIAKVLSLSPIPEPTDLEMIANLLSLCRDVERATRWEEETAAIYDRAPRSRIVGVVEVFPIGPGAREAILDDLTDNWFYDRKAGVVLINMNRGSHEGFAAHLYSAYTGTGLWSDVKDSAGLYKSEKFLAEGMGFYKSSASSSAITHPNTRMTPQEKTVFRGFNFMKTERFR